MPEHEASDLKPPYDDALEVLDLGNEAAGRWLVETASRSSYLVTADEEGCVTFVRTPRSAPSRPVDAEWPSADLRGDGAPVRVFSVGRTSVADDGERPLVGEVRVGFPVVWLVEPLAENADMTARRTTEVVAITRLP